MGWSDRDAMLAHLEKARAARLAVLLAGQTREIDDCPADRHRHSERGWREDGCRCPSTLKVMEHKRERDKVLSRERRVKIRERVRDPRVMAQVNLHKADRFDAEHIAAGYRMPRADIHTRGLAVKIMRERTPWLTDTQVAERLTSAGQGRMVSHGGAEPVYEPVSVRQVQRIVAALNYKKTRRVRSAG